MIKKLLIAAVVSGATISMANAAPVYKTDDVSLDIGGRVQTNFHSVRSSKNKDKATIQGKARLRTNGSVKIADGFKAIEFTEWEVAAQTSENGKFNTRYAYVGFKTDDFGQLTFGQDHTAMYQVFGKTDIFTDYTFSSSPYWDFGGRQEGQAIYKIKTHGVSFAGSYQTSSLNKVDSGYALALGYEFNKDFPISINFGYDRYNLTNNDDRYSTMASVSAGTNGDGLYAATFYQVTDYDHQKDKDTFEIVGSYAWESGFKWMLAYRNIRQDKATLADCLVTELDYNFNANFKAFVEANFGLGDIDKVDESGRKIGSTHDNSGNLFSAALQYNF